MVWYKKVDSFLSIDRKRRYLVQKPSNATFSCRTLYGSYPVSVMFSYCLIGGCHGSAFLYLYVIASRLGEEAAIFGGFCWKDSRPSSPPS